MIDAVLATGAAAGLLELAVTGQIGSARRGVLGLLVPGLLGLAVAVIASRLLPLACRAAFAWTGTRGGLALFLALRHVARRPGGTRTTIVLATAFALSTFAVTAWTVGRSNEHLVADAEVGAPTVLTVGVTARPQPRDHRGPGRPGGRRAAAVDRYTSTSSGTAGLTVLAVDPQRFARVAGVAARLRQRADQRTGPQARPARTGRGDPAGQRGPDHRPRARALSGRVAAVRRCEYRGFTGQPGRVARAWPGHPHRVADRLPLRAAGPRSQPATAGLPAGPGEPGRSPSPGCRSGDTPAGSLAGAGLAVRGGPVAARARR